MMDENKKKRGRPRKADSWTAALLMSRANEYFDKCDKKTKIVATKSGLEELPDPTPYSIEGLCDYLWILRSEFYAWRKGSSDLARTAQLIHQRITANRITGALRGEQNGSFAQFMLKNNNPEDYRDKMEVESHISDETKNVLSQWSEQWKQMTHQ